MKIIHKELGRDPLYKVWNCIDGHMIIYMYSDGGNIVFHDKMLPIKKGVLCYIGPGIYHYTLPDVPQEYVRSKIYISDEIFHKILDVTPNTCDFYKKFNDKTVLYAQLPSEHFAEVERIFDEVSCAHEYSLTPEFICAYMKLMIYIEKYSTVNIPASSNCVSLAIEYINSNYQNRITLDELCGITYVSKHHLCRCFKKAMGITVMEYILSTRISIAQKMLLTSNLPIGEISERCGFSSFAYFCQAFKEATGTCANQYRNG